MSFLKRLCSISVLFVFACTSNHPTSPTKEGNGAIAFQISFQSNSSFKLIADSAVLTISASDMATISKKLTIGDSTIADKVIGIPSGPKRLLQLKVYDSTGTVRYSGSETTNIIADSTLSVSMDINRLVGSLIINGSINESAAWTVADGFEDTVLSPKWVKYSSSIGALTTSKYHSGAKAFEVTHSDFKYTFDTPIKEGQISWWYYDNSGTPYSYFYILSDTSKADLTVDNVHLVTNNSSTYSFYYKTLGYKNTINRVTGWRHFVATISGGVVSISVDGQIGITANIGSPVIAFQVAGAIMDDFSATSF